MGQFDSHLASHHEANSLRNLEKAVHPRPRCERQYDILLTVERTSRVIRKNEPGPSGLFALERVVAVDDIAALKNRSSFLIRHCWFSVLG